MFKVLFYFPRLTFASIQNTKWHFPSTTELAKAKYP